MKICKKILLISIIALVCSIILGNVFYAIDFEIGRYIAMGILYISGATGVITLIGYIITRKNEDEKMPTWIIVIIGIIIALVLANVISAIIEYQTQQKDEYNTREISNSVNKENINNIAIACAQDTKDNRVIDFLGKVNERIEDIRYTEDNGTIIILIRTTLETIYAYKGTSFYGIDATADISTTGKNSEEISMINVARQIRQWWNNGTELDTNEILSKIE